MARSTCFHCAVSEADTAAAAPHSKLRQRSQKNRVKSARNKLGSRPSGGDNLATCTGARAALKASLCHLVSSRRGKRDQRGQVQTLQRLSEGALSCPVLSCCSSVAGLEQQHAERLDPHPCLIPCFLTRPLSCTLSLPQLAHRPPRPRLSLFSRPSPPQRTHTRQANLGTSVYLCASPYPPTTPRHLAWKAISRVTTRAQHPSIPKLNSKQRAR
jgi:hypothetical protein